MFNKQFYISRGLTIIILIVCSLLFIGSAVHAQGTEYELLAPIPLNGNGVDTPTANTTTYLAGLVRLTIGIAGVLAVIMIIFGGIKYLSSEAWGNKSDAKDTITNAIMGLLLAISAWLILNTINPNLVKINLTLPKKEIPLNVNPSTSAPIAASNIPSAYGSGLSEQAVRSQLTDANIKIVAPYVAGLQQQTIDMLKNLRATCGTSCDLTMTSGTSGVHKPGECSHANGFKVDLRITSSLTNFITSTYPEQSKYSNGDRVFKSPGGTTFVWETHPPTDPALRKGWGPHWDVAVAC